MYQLIKGDKVLSEHPTINTAKVSSLFHTAEGQSVMWRDLNHRHEGVIDDKVVFTIKWKGRHPPNRHIVAK